MKMHLLAVPTYLACVLVSCLRAGGGGPQSAENPAEAFTQSVSFDPSVGATSRMGALPTPNGAGAGPSVQLNPGAPAITVSPMSSTTISVPFGGGPVRSVNISFGGPTYFNVSVGGAASGASQGTAQFPVQLGNFCANLSDVCHMIGCYEQVVTADGIISAVVARQMVLNCTGGRDCDGASLDAGTLTDVVTRTDAPALTDRDLRQDAGFD